MSFHLEMRMRELVERGESPARARELARRRFGDYESSRRECVGINERRRRRMRRSEFIAERVQDIRYALRMFRRSPGFTALAVLTLALGIGANAAVFSKFYQFLLRPLPVTAPNQLVNLVAPGPKPGPKSCGIVGTCDSLFSYPMFRDLERLQTVFTAIAAHRDFDVNLGYRGQTLKGDGMLVSGSYFSVLGLRPALGRLLGPDDDRRVGGSEVVVLSHAYWQTYFGGRPTAIDETVFVNGTAMTVVGVTPEGFEGVTAGLKPQVCVPIAMRWRMQPWPESPPENRRGYWVYLFARLKPGVKTGTGGTRSIRVPRHHQRGRGSTPAGSEGQTMAQFRAKGIRLDPGSRGQSEVFERVQVPLTLLLGVTAFVLLIACVNVANLLLARAAARSRELATRLSIGATRGRLIAQLLTESSVLALVAGAASLLVARWTMALIRSQLPADSPSHLDASALIVTAVLAVGASIAVGLFPALHAARPDVLSTLKAQPGQPAGGRRAARFRISLATAQVALSMVLIVLAGLFTKSLANVSHVDTGLKTDGVITFAISPQRNGYSSSRSAALFEGLEERSPRCRA